MDAVKFLKEKKRMCDKYSDCTGCPASEKNTKFDIGCGSLKEQFSEEFVAIVEKWSAENPIKTRQSEFLNLHPNAKINSSGALAVCPLHIDTGAVDICNLINLEVINLVSLNQLTADTILSDNDTCEKCCKEYWLAEVE